MLHLGLLMYGGGKRPCPVQRNKPTVGEAPSLHADSGPVYSFLAWGGFSCVRHIWPLISGVVGARWPWASFTKIGRRIIISNHSSTCGRLFLSWNTSWNPDFSKWSPVFPHKLHHYCTLQSTLEYPLLLLLLLPLLLLPLLHPSLHPLFFAHSYDSWAVLRHTRLLRISGDAGDNEHVDDVGSNYVFWTSCFYFRFFFLSLFVSSFVFQKRVKMEKKNKQTSQPM